MPYNLRKRKAPEPKDEVSRKRPATTAAKRKTEVDVRVSGEDTKALKAREDTKALKAREDTKALKEREDTKALKAREDTKALKAREDTKGLKAREDTKALKAREDTKALKAREDSKTAVKESKDAVQSAKLEEETVYSQLAFGVDSCGELGLKKIGFTRKSPALVPITDSIKQVACGPMHTVTLTRDGQIYTYGCNDEGALGRLTDGDETLEATPTVVELNNKVIKVTAGDSHTAVLTDDNKVFVWGNFRDEHGSIGLTPACDGKASFEPIQLLPDAKFKDIASGSNHMLLLDVDGVVYSFGVGGQGQLGRLKPEEIGDDKCPNQITAENRDLYLTPRKVNLDDVDRQRPFVCDAVFAGNFSSFATNTDKVKNRLASWGLNNYFQLGYKGQKDQNVQHLPRRSTFTCSTSMINVACGQHHTLFLTRTGRVYAAGRHEYGMLGLGKVDKEVCPAKSVSTLTEPITDISVGINTSFAVSREGTLYAWGMGGLNLGLQGEDDLKVPTEVKSLEGKKVVSVSAGGSFTSVVVN